MPTAPSGILLIDKPKGWRSRQVVDAVGKRFGVRKIGHAGTLDPGATGLLVLLLGEGTKLSQFLMSGRKLYRATAVLGQATDTYDADGEVVAEHPIDGVTEAAVREAMGEFRGTIMQRPPDYAAIKVAGQPLYKYARKGKPVDVEPRPVTIHSLQVLRVELPEVEFELSCSKGTYVRSIAHDLGQKLGVGGHLNQIARIENAPFHLHQAHALDPLLEGTDEAFAEAVIPVNEAMPNVPKVVAGEQLAARITHGRPVPGELLYGEIPTDLKAGDLVQIETPGKLAVMEVVHPPAELGPPPWQGTSPLTYLRVLKLPEPAGSGA